MYKLIPLILLLTGCIPVEDITIEGKSPDLPCIDGWQFDFIGQPITNPDTGEQLRCEAYNGT